MHEEVYVLKKLPMPAEGGVLVERNTPTRTRLLLSHISASSRRRHEALQVRRRREKQRKRRLVRRIEYQRLRTMVPSIAAKPLVSKVTVIEEAIRYIDYLHGALLARLRTKGLPGCLQDVKLDVDRLSLEDIKALVCQLYQRTPSLQQQQQQPQQQRSRHVPSYVAAARLPLRKRS